MRAIAPLAAVALLGACTVGPNYHAPDMKAPPAFAEATPNGEPGSLAGWWTRFDDAELNRLVAIALAQSIDVQTAMSRVREARLGVTIARSAALPTLTAAAQGQHSDAKQSADLNSQAIAGMVDQIFPTASGLTIPNHLDLPDMASNSYNVGLDASWQIDLFGGVRRSVEAARAQTEAAQWDLRDAQVTLVSEVAAAYLQLREYQTQEAVARAEIARQQRSLQIMGDTARVGLLPQGDYVRQRAQLASAQASLPPLEAEARIQIHAIALLLAQPSASLVDELSVVRPYPQQPPTVPPGLPSELLRRRPDVRAAERRLAAATASIGVAVADLYPKFSLTGAAQLMSMAFGNLLTLSGRTANAAGAVSFPILDWGRREATVGTRREEREQAYLAYQQTVLSAIKDVEDALVRLDAEQRRNAVLLRKGVADAQSAVRAVDARYRTGLVNLGEVLQAQASVLQQQDALAQSDAALRTGLIALYRALGGGWQDAPAPNPPPATR